MRFLSRPDSLTKAESTLTQEYKIEPKHWQFINPMRASQQILESILDNTSISGMDHRALSETAQESAKGQGCSIKFARLARLDLPTKDIVIGHKADPVRAARKGEIASPLGRGFHLEFDDDPTKASVRVMIFDSDSGIEKKFVKDNLKLCTNILKKSGYSYKYPEKVVIIQGDKQIY